MNLNAESPHFLFSYLEQSVINYVKKIIIHITWQGDLADLSFVSGDGFLVKCHKQIAVSLSPFLLSSILDAGPLVDAVILPDFSIGDICGLVSLLYTGK